MVAVQPRRLFRRAGQPEAANHHVARHGPSPWPTMDLRLQTCRQILNLFRQVCNRGNRFPRRRHFCFVFAPTRRMMRMCGGRRGAYVLYTYHMWVYTALASLTDLLRMLAAALQAWLRPARRRT